MTLSLAKKDKLLKTAYSEVIAECDTLQIPYGNITNLTINCRAKYRWGQCSHLPNGNYAISISTDLIEPDSVEGLKNTLMHEILHTIKGCMNHGTNWKQWADLVNSQLGYDVKRTNSAEELNVNREPRTRQIRYKLECTCCGGTVCREKMTRAIKYPHLYKCGKCGGELRRVL